MRSYFPAVEFLNDQRAWVFMEMDEAYLDALPKRLVYGEFAAANMDGGDCWYEPILPCGA